MSDQQVTSSCNGILLSTTIVLSLLLGSIAVIFCIYVGFWPKITSWWSRNKDYYFNKNNLLENPIPSTPSDFAISESPDGTMTMESSYEELDEILESNRDPFSSNTSPSSYETQIPTKSTFGKDV